MTAKRKPTRGHRPTLTIVDDPAAEPRPRHIREQTIPDTRQIDGTWWRWTDDGSALGARVAGALQLDLNAGRRPGGKWARHISVYVSPTGRSVRVFVDGQEVPARG